MGSHNREETTGNDSRGTMPRIKRGAGEINNRRKSTAWRFEEQYCDSRQI